MGNSSSSSGRGHHDETVDYGHLVPQGVYTGPREWNQAIVSQLIVARRMAPFYRPLEDYEESWDDDQVLAARKELPDPENADTVTRIEATATASNNYNKSNKRPGSLKEPIKPEAQIYRGAVECPICFLYYPPNINHSRCCDQAICTECFVQIKRTEPTATHLESEPAACPYCVQDNFGIVYTPPTWRAGLGSDGTNAFWAESTRSFSPMESTTPPTHKRRQKSFGADSPEVVTTDQIRPDWEAKLEAVRAAVARRANRRIIMRQVGDRLIPVGVTSGRVQVLSPEEAAAAAADGGSRRNRRRQNQQNGQGQFEQFMGMAGQDLEELMLMEAMRLSLIDHETHQKNQADEKKKKDEADAAAGGTGQRSSGESTETQAAPGPGPSTLEGRLSTHTSFSSNLSSSASSIPRSASPSSPPTHTKVGSQESLAPTRKSWSLSRSRTPPPPNPVPNVPLSEENSAAWRNRAAGPPAFSTLSAALTSTSTAAAFLGATPGGEDKRPSRSTTPDPTAHQHHATSSSSSTIPTITVVGSSSPEGSSSRHLLPPASSSGPSSSSSQPEVSEGKAPERPATAPQALSNTSSLFASDELAGIEGLSYGHLPSSPDSAISQTPLIDSETNGNGDGSGKASPASATVTATPC
ncbi:hypothetical protein B0H34DRAFT_794682 [Crassisporium funariophilum]|nr:hypothetical protein B0H34DRAFT_794682 [Crassisporium funariophilum]